MSRIEIRDYHGDFEDVGDLVRRVWIPEYSGKVWFPLPDAAFFRWSIGAQERARCLVAFEGSKLVGSVSYMLHSLRIHSSIVPVAIHTSFSVDPDHRRAALPLIEQLRRNHRDEELELAIGLILDPRTSLSYRFWTKYAETFPDDFRLLLRGSYWAKFLEPQVIAVTGVNAWERAASRALGPLLRIVPHGRDPHVRPYRTDDLEQCSQIIERASAAYEWVVVWSPEDLSHQLDNPECGTLVFERDGRIRGLINYLLIWLYGRGPIRIALIDIWADDQLAHRDRVRLLSHLCQVLRESGVHGVVAPRNAVPAAPFLANLFVPATDHFRIGVHIIGDMRSLTPPRIWSLPIR
ncbi:MAG: GNAT family N-acetyltransferase [Xanthobacteraceae bacterium]